MFLGGARPGFRILSVGIYTVTPMTFGQDDHFRLVQLLVGRILSGKSSKPLETYVGLYEETTT